MSSKMVRSLQQTQLSTKHKTQAQNKIKNEKGKQWKVGKNRRVA
jgi:hypothetical protein